METKYDIGTTKRETIKEKKGKIDKLSYPAPGQSRFLTQQTSYSVVIASGGGQHPLFGTRLHLSSSPNRPRDGEYGQQKHNSQIVISKKKKRKQRQASRVPRLSRFDLPFQQMKYRRHRRPENG